MSFFVSNQRLRGKAGSHLALAIALATGTAVVATGFADPANAMQRSPERKKDNIDEEDKIFLGTIETFVSGRQRREVCMNHAGNAVRKKSGKQDNELSRGTNVSRKSL